MSISTLTGVKIRLDGEQVKTIQTALKQIKKMPKNRTITFLQYGKFNIADNKVHFTVMDDQNIVTIKLENSIITGDNNYSWLFPLSIFRELKGVKKDDIFIVTIENEKITMLYNRVTKHFPVPQKDYPNIKELNSIKELKVNNDYIQSLYDATKFVANSESRPVLQYICHRNGSHISTDSHRLYKKDNIYDTEAMQDEILVSVPTAKLLYNLMKKENEITVRYDEKYIQYESNNITIQGTLYNNSTYPDINRILPNNFNYEFNFDRKIMLEVLKQTKKNQLLHMELLENSNVLSLTVKEWQGKNLIDVYKTSIEVEKEMHNDELNIHFNVTYFIEALKQIKDNTVTMKLINPVMPFTLETEKDYHLILPIKKA